MDQITFPLKARTKGPQVANLQAALKLLIERGILLRDDEAARRDQSVALERDLAKTTFGSATRKLIVLFQERNSLSPTGEVDESTAQALNSNLKELGAFEDDRPDELPEFQHLVRGQVRYEDGLPIAGLKVQAFDKHLRRELGLGEATTDADGRYEIYYSVEELRRKGQRTVCLLVRVLGKKEGERGESVLAESDIVFEAGIVEKINLRIAGGIQHAWSEYEQLMTEIEPLLEGAPVSSLSEDEKRQDISYLSGKVSRDLKKLAQLAGAHKLADKTGLPPEVLFGLARQQLPLKISALLAQSPRRRRNALLAAIQEHIIPGRLIDELERIQVRFQELAAKHAIEGVGDEALGPVGALLGMTGLPKAAQAGFAAEFLAHRAPVPEFWKKLRDDPQYRDHVDEIQFTFQLSALTANHLPLARRLQELQQTGRIRNVRDLAQFNADDWKKIVLQPDDTGKTTFPPEISGKDDGQKAGRYAEILARMVEDAFPVESLAQRMQRPGDSTPADTRKFFRNVLDLGVSFGFGHATIDTLLKDSPALLEGVGDVAALARDLKARQRLFNLVPRHEAIVPLLDAGLTSASAINRMGRKAFAARFGPQLGGNLAAMKIHAKAGYITAAALNVIANLAPWFRHPIDVLPSTTPGVAGIPDWETLFGPFDLCACDQCRSVHSPAAYLAELLAFLKERKATAALPGGGTTEIDMREALFRRRPDLGDIELTCENTNIRMPYVDLTNEILENAIRPFQPFVLPHGAQSHLDKRSLSAEIRAAFRNAGRGLEDVIVVIVEEGKKWLITDRRRLYSVRLEAGRARVVALGYQTFGTENDLAANPSHVNAEAYADLRSAVHPWSLPLDLWALETRVWLERAGIERADLMRAFQPKQAPVDPSTLAVACETIGMTRNEMEIVTGADPRAAWEFWGMNEAGNHVEIPDPAAPAKTVTAALGWVEALSHVRPLLRQTGLSYDEVLRLLATRFVNPAGDIRVESVDANDRATCDTQKLALTNLTAKVLDRLHRFVRLWRKLGWTIRELDLAIAVFQGGNPDPNSRLTTRLLEQLAAVKLGNKEIGIPLERLLSLWGTIDTQRGVRGDPAGEDSLYDKLFLNPSVLKPVSSAFILNAARSELAAPGAPVAPHISAIAGSMGIAAADLTRLTGEIAAGLTLANLSALHRHVTLAAGLGLSIGDCVLYLKLTGINPFDPAHPEDTLGFIQAVQRMTAAGFSIAEVDYLLRHQLDADPSLAPGAETIAAVLTETRAGLQNVWEGLAIESDLNGDLTRKDLGLLKWDPAQIELVVSTLNSNPAFSAPLEDLPGSTAFPPGVQGRVAWDSGRHCLTFAGIMTAADRALLSGVAVPPALQANYDAAVDLLYRQSSTFLDAVRVYERPVFRVALARASMPSNSLIPHRLRSRFFYDRKAEEACFSGLMLAADHAEIAGITGVDAAFTSAVDQLHAQSSDFPAAGENEFLAEAAVAALLAAGVQPPQRFQAVLEKLVPRLRRLLGESLVKQKLSEALGGEAAALGCLLDDATLRGFLAPDFAESNAALDVTADRFPLLFDAFARLSKGLLVAGKLGFGARQLAWYFRFLPSVPERDVPWTSPVPARAGWLDFRTLPLTPNQDPVPVHFASLLRLIALREVRDQIRPAGDLAQEEIFAAAREPALAANAAALTDRAAQILKRRGGWDEEGTKALCGASGLALVLPADLQDEVGLVRLARCHSLARRVNALPGQACGWAREDATEKISHEIKQALRARHGEGAWQQIARAAQDAIREAKRAALVAYLLVRPPSVAHMDGASRPAWHNANGLFAYFLIDVEMTPCWTTSRLKQAISSVQLFVQRCLLNLETGLRIDAGRDDAWLQWKWMKNYRVWEANRKIFLYPENWIEPELRDDKTPFFKALENELLQNELTAGTAEDAFLHYLEKLDAVARLELVGMYQQDAADGQQPVLHVFGRTQGTPAVYYYRRRVGTGRWTPWEPVELDIEGDHLIPITWNRRLYLFWPVFSIKARQDAIYPKDSDGKPPTKLFEIQLAWSEYKNGRWLPKRITSRRIVSAVPVKEPTAQNPDDDGRNDHVFFADIANDGLRIWPEWDNPHSNYSDLAVDEYNREICLPQTVPFTAVDTFLFSGCHGDAVIESGRNIYGVFNPSGTRVKAMRFREYPADVPLRLPVDASTVREEDALGTTPGSGGFELLYPHQDYFLTGRRPFFFQDQARSFLVRPERLPVSSFKWHLLDAVDPGQIHALKEHYYCAWAGQPSVWNFGKAARWRPETRPLADTGGIQTKAPLTQRDLQVQRRRVNILDASPWLDVKQLLAPEMVLPVLRRVKRYRFQTFHHPYVSDFIKSLNRGGVDELLALEIQESRHTYFVWTYHPKGLVDPDYPVDNVDFTPGGAYSQYNWELFFHVPMLIAARLSQNQRFEEAQRWFHYVFDPTNASGEDAPRKFWRTKPFHDLQREDYLRQRIEQLVKPSSSGMPNPELALEIEEWRNNPFSPHAVARLRLTAYQKSVVMKYLDNIIAWGDQLFRRDTVESINEATQLYVLASDMLGARPTEMAPRAQPQVQTYNSLDPLLSEFSNTLVEIEYLVPSPSPDAVLVKRNAPAISPPAIPYFCVPRNDKLMSYWSRVGEQLFKIRHGMNIEGVVRQLALFEPPIEPGLLVRAAAAGVDLGSVLNDMNAPLPSYRFQIMAQKASELTAEVKALGAALLSAIEKRDAEALALLRSTHEIALLKQVREVRKQQARDAAENVTALERGKQVTEARRDFYRTIARINENEQLHMDKLQSAHLWQMNAQMAELVAAVVPLIGDFDLGASGWGSTPVVKWRWGGMNIGLAAQAAARAMNVLASIDQYEATNASIKGGFDRRWDEWKQQEKLANLELRQMETQIAGALIRQAIAEKELSNHDLQTDNARAADEMMRSKFSNRDLFDWMVSQVSALYFQSYQLAYDVARRAERAYQYELGVKDSNFIQFGYWDSLKKGLLAGERLSHDLKRMEVSYLDQHKREYEITKHVSLALLHPQALASLKEFGSCFFELPEAIFDLDHPGQYLRRIKSVSLSLPCVAGPYTSVSAKLTLLGNRIRRDAQVKPDGSDYAWRGVEDPRFTHDLGGIQSIVTSTGREDGGLFELNFRDERYLPFEGAGITSSWRLELPAALRQFDYDTISDVIVHVRYTARDGGELLKTAVSARLIEALRLMTVEQGKAGLFRLFSLRHDFPDRWHQFLHSAPVQGEPVPLTLELSSALFPAYAQQRTIRIKKLLLMVQAEKPKAYDPLDPLAFSVTRPGSPAQSPLEAQGVPGDLSAAPPAVLDLGGGVIVREAPDQAVWKFAPTQIPGLLARTVDTVDVLDPESVRDMAVLCHYTIE